MKYEWCKMCVSGYPHVHDGIVTEADKKARAARDAPKKPAAKKK